MLLPPKLAAQKCGVSRSTFYEWSNAGVLGFPPARVVKGRRFWLDSELDVWMSALPREPIPREPQE